MTNNKVLLKNINTTADETRKSVSINENLREDNNQLSTNNESHVRYDVHAPVDLHHVLEMIPYFIVTLSRPYDVLSGSLKRLSSSAVLINPSRSESNDRKNNAYSPFSLINSSTLKVGNTNNIQNIVVITNSLIILKFVSTIFRERKSYKILFFPDINTLITRNPELIEGPHSHFNIFIIYLMSWNEIVGDFALHGFSITGGNSSQRHMLSPTSFRLALALEQLGLHYSDLVSFYKTDKSYTNPKRDAQNSLLSMYKKLFHGYQALSQEEINNILNENNLSNLNENNPADMK